jgi:hypothetical protein
MRRDLLRYLQLATVLKVGGYPCRAERVIANLRLDPRCLRAPANQSYASAWLKGRAQAGS